MSKESKNLREIFEEIDSRLNDTSSSERRSLAQRMKGELKGVEWVASMPNLVEKIAELLNIELPTLLMQLWKTSDKIKDALKRSEAEPGQKIILGLFDQKREGTFHPEIEVTVTLAGVPSKFPLTFDLLLCCAWSGVELTIRNGEILSIDAGSCEVEGTLEYKKLVLARAPRKGSKSISLGLEMKTGVEEPAVNV